ncbi:hypothetical protein V8F20_000319 [Naviculisporaceae sp. PSN 640]
MTAIGPLTTTFQAPSSCTTTTPQIYQVHNTQDHDTYSYVQGPLFKSGSNCFPSGYDASPSAYYSPGVCPQGYTAACTKTSTIRTAIPAVPAGDEDAVETAFICCPTATGFINYTCAEAKDGGSSNTKGAAPFMGCQMAFSRAHGVIGATVIKEDGSTGSYGVFTESEGLFAAHSIQVRFRASDSNSPRILNVPGQTSSTTSAVSTIPTSEPTARTTVATFSVPSQTSPPGGSNSNSNSQSDSGETKTEGVSTGAAVGIAIGSAIAGILIFSIIGLFFFLRWRRKRRPPPVPPKEGHNDPSLFNNGNPNIAITVNGDTLRPPYELSEEAASNNNASASRSRSRSQSRRLRMMSSRRTRPSTRRGAVPSNSNDPAELEAVVPSNASSNMSFRSDDRSNPESTRTASSTGWMLGLGQPGGRDGVTPTPWI